ncbi:xanthine dehydrogenase family protein subunit M [soil metagenome]
MKAAPFAYHRPDTIDEVTETLAYYGDDGKILAGGQSLTALLAMRLTHFENLIDVSMVDELKGVHVRDDTVWVKAATTHSAVGKDADVAYGVPLLTRVTPHIGHFQIRNRGTLGGAVAHGDPAGEFSTVALTLDAEIEAASMTGTRRIPATEFFTGLWETSLEPGEVLTAVGFPVWGARSGFGFHEFARRHGDFAIAGATVAVQLDGDDKVIKCGIGLLGLGSTPLRAASAEADLLGRAVTELDPNEVGALAMSALDEVPSDQQGSAHYRKRVGAAMVARALTDALAEAVDNKIGAATDA